MVSKHKVRTTVTASSLGNYFNQGYIDVKTQLEQDLGIKEVYFSRHQELAMELGKTLENSTLDYFEKFLDISIVNRNSEVLDAFDGMLRCMIDGETIYNGEPTVVECKITRSDDPKENLGYELQVQSYMKQLGYNQALLLGLHQGVPFYKLIKRNEDMINDIETVVYTVFSILNGFNEVHELDDLQPIWSKYSTQNEENQANTLDNVTDEEEELLQHYLELSKQAKEVAKEMDSIKERMLGTYNNVVFKNDDFKMSITPSFRQGSIDTDLLKIDYPDIDLEKYRKNGTTFNRFTLTQLKKGK